MSNDLNKTILIGRLTRDPEFKTTPNNQLANFSLASNSKYKDKEEVSFFDCVAWGKLAEIIRDYAKKGKQILIEGRLKQESWDTPEGKKASKVFVIVEFMQLLGDPKDHETF